MRPYERLLKCWEEIRKRTDFRPQVGIVLGSGLGGYADNMEISCEIPYREIPGFPVSTVQGHDGKFLFGYVKNTPVILMKGRVHYYEGYPMEDVVLPVRLMGLLGADTVILTNAAGGINRTFQAGDLMLITDHICIAVPNPLRGENIDELGTRFPDMSHVYDPELQEAAKKTAARQGISLREGIYVQCSGPSYETPAEIRMLGALGADAVGMSTVCEAIAARHMGMKVCGISCITNLAAGILDQPLDHREVQKSADQAKEKFENLITGLVGK